MQTQPANQNHEERKSFNPFERSVPSLRGTTTRAVAAAAALSLLGVFAFGACGDDDSADASSAPATVKATQADGTITLDKTSGESGSVEFAIENTGKLTHEFIVLKTDLAEGDLPLLADRSAVDEEGDGVKKIGEQENIAPGAKAELSLDKLAAGKYVLICNVPGHYGLGMHTTFTVN